MVKTSASVSTATSRLPFRRTLNIMRLVAIMVIVFALVAWDLSQNGGTGIATVEGWATDFVGELGLS